MHFHRFGDTTLQENINQENLELLKEYYKLFTEKMPPDCEYRTMQYPDGFEKLWWVKGYKMVILAESHNFFHKFKHFVSVHSPADVKSDFRPNATAETTERMKQSNDELNSYFKLLK